MNAIAQVSRAPMSGPKLDNRRVAAAIIDLLIVSVGAVAILVAGDSLSGDRQSALTAVILGWGLYYFFALESGEGQTLGKKVMKIRVVRADGRPAGMGEIAVRTILRVVDNYLVGLIVMLATGEKRQRIGDLAAGTIVVDASGPAVAVPTPAEVLGVDEAADEDEAEADDADADAAAEEDPVATETITLPSRPAPPATLADLDESEEEPAAEEELPSVASPAIEELAQDLAAAHAEPEAEVAEEPVAEVIVEDESVIEEAVAAATVEDEPVVEIESQPVDAEDSADGPQDDEPVVVKPVQTVSAMDLVMGAAEEQAAEDASEESSHDDGEPASA